MARERDEEQDIDQDEGAPTVADVVEELEELPEVKALSDRPSTKNALRAIAKYILSRSDDEDKDDGGQGKDD